jgi:N-methylhydantoinase B
MTVDPITLEVFRNRFDVIAKEMQSTLLRSAYSIILKEGADASCALFSARGEIIAQADAQPLHLAALVPAVQRILQEFPPSQIREGDVYCMNDPYDGGTHIPDLIVVVPVLHNGTPIALGCALAHQQDFGGKAPGSMVTDATEVFQEGLTIPPSKLYDAGELNKTLHKIIERNVRIPLQVLGDINAQVSAGKTARRRMLELVDEYGVETFLSAIDLTGRIALRISSITTGWCWTNEFACKWL